MRKAAILIVLALASLGLTACHPGHQCGQDHRGWVQGRVPSGPDVGAKAAVYMEWTSMGTGPHCVGTWTGNPRPYPASPFTGCFGGATGNWSSFGDGWLSEITARCSKAGWTIEVAVRNYRSSAAMFSTCRVSFGSTTLDCSGQHVT